MPSSRRSIAWLVAAATVAGVVPLAVSAVASATTTFTCVTKNANNCVVTIQLTSDMNEQVGSTMPDKLPWFQHIAAGSQGTGGYSISGPGAPQTYWNGKSGGTQGTVWSALLTTGTVTAGAYASLTFTHVTTASKPYTSITESHPTAVATNTTALVTAVVKPVPAKGHLLLQRKGAGGWANLVAFAYAASKRSWSARFKWPYPKGSSRSFRVLATKAPGLLQTASAPFTIRTLG